MADVNRLWLLKSRPEGMVSESCFDWFLRRFKGRNLGKQLLKL